MSKSTVLGILDTLETLFLDKKRVPFTDYILCDESHIMLVLSRLRSAIDDLNTENKIENTIEKTIKTDESQRMKQGANDYADQVLAKLVLVVTQLQKQLVNMERTLEASRELLANQEAASNDTTQPPVG